MKLIKLVLFFSAVCVLHIACVEVLLELEIKRFLIKSYLFLFLLSLFSMGFMYLLNKLKNKSPFHLLSVNMIKIIASVLYLLPFLSNKTEITIYYIIHFFIAYFIILIKEGRENYTKLKAENSH
jgi:hypothetical protein